MTHKTSWEIIVARTSGLLICIAGANLLLSLAIHRFGAEKYESYFIFDFDSRSLTALVGLLLIYLSIHIFARRKTAYKIALFICVVALCIEILHKSPIMQIVVIGVALLSLLMSNRVFTVSSDTDSLRRGFLIAGGILMVAFAYATVGFYEIDETAFRVDYGLAEAMQAAFKQLFSFQADASIHFTRSGKTFLASIDMLGSAAFLLAAYSLFRPLRFRLSSQTKERQLAIEILRNADTQAGPEDFFKIWPKDKHYFFNASQDAFIAYTVRHGSALALDGPSGKGQKFEAIIGGFTTYCMNNGWLPVFIHCDETTSTKLKEFAYKSVFIGNEALISCANFANTTYRSKHFRYIANKSRREGLEILKWRAPLTTSQINTLRDVSNEWLTKDGRREYGFIMGYFDDDYLRRSNCFVAQQNGRVIAYANIIPTYNDDYRSIDHIRHRINVPQTTVHFLLMQAILVAHSDGVRLFNLGLAPLSGIEKRMNKQLPDKFLSIIKRFGGNYYSFQGLEQFKNKYEPEWRPKYISYQGSSTKLLAIARSLESVSTYNNPKNYFHVRLVMVSAAISYAAFPLSALLNPDAFLSSYASLLTKPGQPYWYVFSIFDVLAGTGILLTGLYFLRAKTVEFKIQYAYIIFGLCTLISVLFPVHEAQASRSVMDILTVHATASAIITIATAWIAATVFMIDRRFPGKYRNLSIIVCAGFVGSLVASLPLWVGQYLSQYVAIVMTAVIIILGTEIMIKSKSSDQKIIS